jgi:transposase
LANAAVDQARRRTQQTTLGHRGRKYDPLYRIRKLLLTAQEQRTQRGRVRLRAGLTAGDPDGEVAAAWQGKELLRAVYAAVGAAAAPRRAGALLPLGRRHQRRRTVPAGPHRQGVEAEILAWHATGGCSNGQPRPSTCWSRRVKRVGHGFRNFHNYRLRLLLHCGVTWQTHRTARLRGRSGRVSEPLGSD